MTAAAVPAGAPRSLAGSPGRRRRERAIRYVFTGAALLSIVISIFIVLTLIGKAFEFVIAIDLGSLWSIGWFPRRGLFDLLTLFVGTLQVAAIAMLIAVPVGLGAAIYLSEYASPFARKIIKPVVEILAGIPSVVLGFFALTFISPSIVQNLVPGAAGFNLAAAGVAVGILTVPLIASVSEDALRAVPRSLREASYGLGARRKTTTLRVVFPAAVSGTVAAIILGLLARHRRDDGRRRRGRRLRRFAAQLRPIPARPDDDCCDGSPGDRLGSGRGRDGGVQQPVLHRLPAVCRHPDPERRRRHLRPPHAPAVLGAR